MDEVLSTNDYAIDLLAKSNPNEGTVISTHNQTKGKGQIGRAWFSDEFKNISLSLILRPHFVPLADSFYLSMVLSLSIRDLVEETTTSDNVRIKWPNDIYVENKKIAGILIQQNIFKKKIAACIMGVGLNVNQQFFPSDIPNPISIYNITGNKSDLKVIEAKILIRIQSYYTKLRNRDFSAIKRLYLKNLYKRGDLSSFELPNGQIFTSEIVGVDNAGKLVLKQGNLLHSFAMHEIKMVVKID